MDWRALLAPYQDRLIKSLQGCISFPSVYADDGSGFPYGQAAQDCLNYMLIPGAAKSRMASSMAAAPLTIKAHWWLLFMPFWL